MPLADATCDTRTALIRQATDLIQTHGFCAFSYQDLAERIGIRKASIHHHFPAKADLGVAVVAAMTVTLRTVWRDQIAAHPRVADRLRATCDHVRHMAAAGDRICPVGSLQAEFNALPAPVQEALRAFDAEYLATYTAWLEEGRQSGELVFVGSPRAMAQVLVSVLQAALQRHRANPTEAAGDALDQLLRLLGIPT